MGAQAPAAAAGLLARGTRSRAVRSGLRAGRFGQDDVRGLVVGRQRSRVRHGDRRAALAVLYRWARAVCAGCRGGPALRGFRRWLPLRSRRRQWKTALAGPWRAQPAQGDRQRAADLRLAGARRPGDGRRPGLFRSRPMAVRGHFRICGERRDRQSVLGERPDRLALHRASAWGHVVRRPLAARLYAGPGGRTGGAQQPVVSGLFRSKDGTAPPVRLRSWPPRKHSRQLVRGCRRPGAALRGYRNQQRGPRRRPSGRRPDGESDIDRATSSRRASRWPARRIAS